MKSNKSVRLVEYIFCDNMVHFVSMNQVNGKKLTNIKVPITV